VYGSLRIHNTLSNHVNNLGSICTTVWLLQAVDVYFYFIHMDETVPTGVKEEKFAHTVQLTIQSLEDKRPCLPSWTLLMARIV
jgi:hypothetical protein